MNDRRFHRVVSAGCWLACGMYAALLFFCVRQAVRRPDAFALLTAVLVAILLVIGVLITVSDPRRGI